MSSKFKKILKEIVLFSVLLFIASNVLSYVRAPQLEHEELPKIEAMLITGKRFESKEFSGKPLVVHFWGTWCPVCKSEISNIQSISEKYEVLTIAVNSGSDAALQNYMKQNNYDFRVLNDAEGSLAEKYKVGIFPTTFIYDSDGKLKFTETGYTTRAGLLARLAFLK